MNALPNSQELRGEAQGESRGEVGLLRDEVRRLAAEVEALRARTQEVEALAHEDPLTGALNRRGFQRDLARAIAYCSRYATPAALLLTDLDGFKTLNDTMGHEAGDRALVRFAELVRHNIRASDVLGRLGGDEFALVLWQVDEPLARQKAASLQALLAAGPEPLHASFGVTVLAAGDTPEEAIARADRAMYEQKRGRRGRS